MGMAGTARGRRTLKASGVKPAPVSVAKEFNAADKGRHFPNKHVRPKSVAEVHARR